MSLLTAESTLKRTAIFDATGRYRYQLGRQWQASGPQVAFVMLNPSRADATQPVPKQTHLPAAQPLWPASPSAVYQAR
ncbi:DUF1643 domain-containing protein [Leptolyngbya sp. BC1307]|uniref:DUF1643 domain-containing protein n=1 Tax=Leptolyngbya sp. BC1307 TaxID=2029589 RepID=UPI001F0AA334|nr:DUF1643 domain-containing protein [Leptolyngbya sp. BC1307]